MSCPEIIDHVPDSTILVAQLALDDYGVVGCVAIVSYECDQNTKKGIYWVGRTLPSTILAAIQTDRHKRFDFKQLKYQVIAIEEYKDTQKYLDIISRFCNPSAPQTVYVFTHKNIKQFSGCDYEMVTAMVPCADKSFPAPVTVYYEKDTHRHFINETMYETTRMKYGLPYLRLRSAAEHSQFSGFGGLKQHSELYMLGYSVSSANGLTMQGRRKLLSEIIDSGILSKHEVMNHLEWLIHTRSGIEHMENAVTEWKSDLHFVSQYHAKQQRVIWVNTFKSRFSCSQPLK